jgi:hypothetical protein
MAGDHVAVLADQDGLLNPNALMLPAISAIWESLWVRAFRGEGISRSSRQNSSRHRLSTASPRSAGFGVVLISALPHPSYPHPEFRDNFRERPAGCLMPRVKTIR